MKKILKLIVDVDTVAKHLLNQVDFTVLGTDDENTFVMEKKDKTTPSPGLQSTVPDSKATGGLGVEN